MGAAYRHRGQACVAMARRRDPGCRICSEQATAQETRTASPSALYVQQASLWDERPDLISARYPHACLACCWNICAEAASAARCPPTTFGVARLYRKITPMLFQHAKNMKSPCAAR